MALKVYSDITKEFYEDEAAAKTAEEKLLKVKNEKTARRKEMSEKVEAARQNVNDIRKEYADMIAVVIGISCNNNLSKVQIIDIKFFTPLKSKYGNKIIKYFILHNLNRSHSIYIQWNSSHN